MSVKKSGAKTGEKKELSPTVPETIRKIKQLRVERKMTTNRLAELCGYSQSHLWSLEELNDTSVSLDCVDKMCEVLGVRLSDVIRFSEVSYCFLHSLFLFSRLPVAFQKQLVQIWGATGKEAENPLYYETDFIDTFQNWTEEEQKNWMLRLEQRQRIL